MCILCVFYVDLTFTRKIETHFQMYRHPGVKMSMCTGRPGVQLSGCKDALVPFAQFCAGHSYNAAPTGQGVLFLYVDFQKKMNMHTKYLWQISRLILLKQEGKGVIFFLQNSKKKIVSSRKKTGRSVAHQCLALLSLVTPLKILVDQVDP